MHMKMKLVVAGVAMLLISIIAVNVAMAATARATVSSVKVATTPINASNLRVASDDGLVISPEQAENPDELKKLVPVTLEEAEGSILPIRARYLMWTNDGVHIMWGSFGHGRFVGTDNLGKRCWGIYGCGVFAGFYDGQFFWGKYSNGAWKAQYIFGLRYSYGRYVTFPSVIAKIPSATSLVP
jgi:hypothetical protein